MYGIPFKHDPLEPEIWRAFYEVSPFDDRSRYFRPAALMAHLASPVNPTTAAHSVELQDALDWLDPRPVVAVPAPQAAAGYSEADLAVFKAFGKALPRRKG